MELTNKLLPAIETKGMQEARKERDREHKKQDKTAKHLYGSIRNGCGDEEDRSYRVVV